MQPSLFSLQIAPPTVGRAQVGERERAKALVAGSGKIKDFDFALNPYVGCGFGCSYCYAQFFVADEEKRATWGQWVDVKSGVVQEIMRTDLKDKKVLMSSATDPYQPLEAKLELTREILKALTLPHRQPRLIVQTRSPLVVRDADLLWRFAKIRVNMTIATDDDAIRKEFEPHCASIDRRFEALEQLKSAGIPVGVSVSPVLPIRDLGAFVRRIRRLSPDGGFAQTFHQTDVPFASNTPDWVVKKARSMGWTPDDEAEAARVLRREFSNVAQCAA